jgi:uncharacterized protein (TIGR03437 family)
LVFPAFFGAVLFSGLAAHAQTQDNSQNSLLKGSYIFRHVAVQNVDQNYNPTEMTASYGTITFDGAGTYSIVGTTIDNVQTNGVATPLNVSGVYAIGSNGSGYISNPLYPTDQDALVYGAVAQGVFTGSSTESEQDGNIFNDIFVAVPAATTALTNASFTAQYQTGLIDFTGASGAAIKNALFELSPDGKGGLGAFTLNGQASNQTNSLVLTQSVTGATYAFGSTGAATLTIPLPSGVTATNALLTGTRTMYMSADGNFVLGWTPTGYDIFFGVKTLGTQATNALSQGLYFTSALEDGFFGVDSYYGGTNNSGDAAGDGILHERLNIPGGSSYDFGTDDQTALNANGTVGNAQNGYTDLNGYEYIFGDGGQAYVAIGTNGNYSLLVGMHAANFSGPGVYLNPIGVVNAASQQPVTASIAPGELLILVGTGLSSGNMVTQGGQTFPLSLDGVSVAIDGLPCPIYYVTPNQLSVAVPYAVAANQTGLANIQVTNNNVQSNIVQVYLTDGAPGSFSQGADGIGYAAATHAATGQLITPTNPAQPDEYISLYLTGLGTVTPTVSDGSVGPINPLSYSDIYNAGNLFVNFDDFSSGSTGNEGNIIFAGLAPTLAGLYQINVQVPSGVLTSGDNVYVELETDAADVTEVQIPYGSTPASAPSVRDHVMAKAATAKAARAHTATVSHRARRPASPAGSGS